MSRPRHKWWSYVKGMIRAYPLLRAEYLELKEVPTTVQLTGMPRANDISDKTANIALRTMSQTKQQEYEAVTMAIDETRKEPSGDSRLLLVDKVFWRQTHTVMGAGLDIGISERTAQQWHGDFIRLVARYYGFDD